MCFFQTFILSDKLHSIYLIWVDFSQNSKCILQNDWQNAFFKCKIQYVVAKVMNIF